MVKSQRNLFYVGFVISLLWLQACESIIRKPEPRESLTSRDLTLEYKGGGPLAGGARRRSDRPKTIAPVQLRFMSLKSGSVLPDQQLMATQARFFASNDGPWLATPRVFDHSYWFGNLPQGEHELERNSKPLLRSEIVLMRGATAYMKFTEQGGTGTLTVAMGQISTKPHRIVVSFEYRSRDQRETVILNMERQFPGKAIAVIDRVFGDQYQPLVVAISIGKLRGRDRVNDERIKNLVRLAERDLNPDRTVSVTLKPEPFRQRQPLDLSIVIRALNGTRIQRRSALLTVSRACVAELAEYIALIASDDDLAAIAKKFVSKINASVENNDKMDCPAIALALQRITYRHYRDALFDGSVKPEITMAVRRYSGVLAANLPVLNDTILNAKSDSQMLSDVIEENLIGLDDRDERQREAAEEYFEIHGFNLKSIRDAKSRDTRRAAIGELEAELTKLGYLES